MQENQEKSNLTPDNVLEHLNSWIKETGEGGPDDIDLKLRYREKEMDKIMDHPNVLLAYMVVKELKDEWENKHRDIIYKLQYGLAYAEFLLSLAGEHFICHGCMNKKEVKIAIQAWKDRLGAFIEENKL